MAPREVFPAGTPWKSSRASDRASERNETSRTWRSDSRRMKKDPRGGRGNENARQGESNRSANGETLFMEKGYLNFKRITKHIFLNYAKTNAANIYYIERKLKFKKYARYLLYKLMTFRLLFQNKRRFRTYVYFFLIFCSKFSFQNIDLSS